MLVGNTNNSTDVISKGMERAARSIDLLTWGSSLNGVRWSLQASLCAAIIMQIRIIGAYLYSKQEPGIYCYNDQ